MENEKNQIKPIKILVCSGIKGHIISFIDYLEALYVKKGLFDYVFCIGDFFGDDNCEAEWNQFKRSGKITTVPIYTLGPNKIDHEKYFNNLQDQELAPNIYYLGKDGIFNTSDGLKIGYISGLQSNTCKENDIHAFNYDSLAKFKDSCLRAGTTSLDILLTSPWPIDIRNKERIADNQNAKELADKNSESQLLSWVAINLAPRYYFASLQGVFYERSPYKNINSNTVTRFIGLGNYHNKSKINKWIYGFNLLPAELTTTNKINYTVTESPFSADPSHYTADLLPVSKQYFYNTSTNSNYNHGEPFKKKKFNGQIVKQSLNINPESCWFCLSSKNIAKHMIISIGDQVYLAGTKGPLVRDHILIASIDHFKSFVDLSIESENEINLIKSSLNQYFESTGRVAVYFERNISSAHFQLQVVPVAMEISDQLEHTFKSKFKELDLNLVDIPPAASLRQIAGNSEGNYFYVELPNGKRMFHSAVKKSGHQNFPINLPRVVLASPNLLNVQRVDWRQCLETSEEEEMYAKSFCNNFARFNPIKD